MAIAPYRPSTEALNPLLDDFLRPFGVSRPRSLLRTPETDIVETDNEIRVTAELPGMRSEDIKIDLENNLLTIAGEKAEERTEEGNAGRYHLTERRYGRFARSFVLPRDVEPEKIQARFTNGVLTVVIPKSERAQRRQIDVQDGGSQGDDGGQTANTEAQSAGQSQ